MGRYPVTANGESEPAFVARSVGRRVVLLTNPNPRAFSIDEAEEIRRVLGFAIADAQAGPSDQDDDGQHGLSRGGGDRD
jgi:hypothetical protein